MKTIAITISVIIALAVPASAKSYKARNRLVVNSISANVFEVVESNGAGARQIWCAAAEFNERVLGNQKETDLIVKEKRGAAKTVQGRKGVIFTNDPAQVSAPLSKSVSVSVNVAGMTLPSHHARTFCQDTFIRNRR